MNRLLPLFLLSLLLSACQATGTKALTSPPPTGERIYLRGSPDWSDMKAVARALRGKATVRGREVDLRGNTLDGSKIKHPKNSQDENSTGVRIRIPGFTLRNGTVSNIPGGLIISAPGVTLQNLSFIRPGEDFASTVGKHATGLTVTGCRFYNNSSGDKSLQANNAAGLLVRDTLITGGITGARVQESSYPQRKVRALFERVKFIGCHTALNIDGDTVVTARDCTFDTRKIAVVRGRAQLKIPPK